MGKEAIPHSAASENSPSQFAHFGMVSRGNCWLSIEGIPDPLPLTGGDCFLLAPGSSYALRDDPRTRARSFCEVASRNGGNVIRYGGAAYRPPRASTQTQAKGDISTLPGGRHFYFALTWTILGLWQPR